MAAIGNSRAGKLLLRYDGHSRKAGVQAADRERRWRHWRRQTKRWLREVAA